MNHKTHSYLMIGLLVVGSALFFSGFADGGVLFLLWPLVCMAMMGAMMWWMMSGGMGRGRPDATVNAARAAAAADRPSVPGRRPGA